MPPITTAPQNTRGTLISWLIVFIILFVTAAVLAIYCDAQWNKDSKTLSDLRGKYNAAVTEADLANVSDFLGGSTVKTGGSTIQNVANQRKAADKLIAGNEKANPEEVLKSATDTLAVVTSELKEKGVSVSLPPNLLQSIRILGDQVRSTADAAAKSQADAKSATDSALKVTQERDKLLAAKDAELASARTELQKVQQQVQEYQNTKNASVAQIQQNAQESVSAANKRAESLQTDLSEANRLVASAQEGVRKLQGKLDHLRLNPNESLQRADGNIQLVADSKTAYINIGQSESVTPGLTFEVYDSHRGLPKLTSTGTDNNGNDLDLPAGKASIEVVRVNQHTSEVRIVKTAPGQIVSAGDLIENLVYDPRTKYNFFVFGGFDMTQPGTASTIDGNLIKDLVTRWGGKLQTDINVDTDFVVFGKEPVVPTLSAEDANNPIAQSKQEQALKAQSAYQEMVKKAMDLRLPILNQNRFLYFTGYYDQAKR